MVGVCFPSSNANRSPPIAGEYSFAIQAGGGGGCVLSVRAGGGGGESMLGITMSLNPSDTVEVMH